MLCWRLHRQDYKCARFSIVHFWLRGGEKQQKIIFKSSNGRDVDVRANELFSLTFSKMPAVNSRRLHLTLFTALPTCIYFSLLFVVAILSAQAYGAHSRVCTNQCSWVNQPIFILRRAARTVRACVSWRRTSKRLGRLHGEISDWRFNVFQLVCKVDKQIIAQLRKQLITAAIPFRLIDYRL